MSYISRQLTLADGPMVWIDCEMTGLDPDEDKIMEIAVLITNGRPLKATYQNRTTNVNYEQGNLELVDEGIEYIVRVDKRQLDRMGEWCTKQHGESGLTEACLSSPFTKEQVAKKVLAYIKKWIPQQRAGVLAGNSIHMDRVFLAKEMPEIIDWLHYRLIDVSSVKELTSRWYIHPSQRYDGYPKDKSHRALSDIQCSIEELKWYRKNIFVPPTP